MDFNHCHVTSSVSKIILPYPDEFKGLGRLVNEAREPIDCIGKDIMKRHFRRDG